MNILNLFKQSFLAKTIIILAVMLTGGANFVWGDTVIKTIDFSDSSWNGMTFNQGNTTNPDYNAANEVTFYSSNSSYQFSLSNGKLTFPDNMTSDNYALGFPVTGIVGGIVIIKVYNGTTYSQVKYAIKDGGTAFNTSDLASGTSALTYATPCTIINTGLADSKAFIYIGRHSSSYKTITKIEVLTIEYTDLSESAFYPLYKNSYMSAANLISGASLPSYVFTDISSNENTNSNSSEVLSPHDFSGLFSASSSTYYYRLKTSNLNTIAIGALSHVKSIRLYGNGSNYDGIINVNAINVSGSGDAISKNINYVNSRQNVTEYSTGDLSENDDYDNDTYYFYTITFAKKSSSSTNFSLWGLYIEYNAPSSYTVTYHPNGGSGEINDATGSSITLSDGTGFSAPSAYYSFAGWNTDPHGTGTNYASGETGVKADLTLYAVWTQSGTIDDNGGTTDGAYTATYNKAGIEITTAPTNGSYAIKGYYEADTDENLVANSAGALEASTTYTDASGYWTHTGSAPTLYAQWENTHTLNVDVNEAYMGSAEADETTIAEGSTTNVTATANPGYKFRSWEVISGTGASLSSTTDNPTSFTMGTDDATVTATFSALEHYTITYNKGEYGTGSAIANGNKTEDVDFTLSSLKYTRSGYIQTGWALSEGGEKAYELGGTYTENADLNLYPYWTEQHTITYDSNSGWGKMTATTGAGEVTLRKNSFIKSGYTFLGWATSQDDANNGIVSYADKAIYQLTADVILYAVWGENYCEIKPNTSGDALTVGDVIIMQESTVLGGKMTVSAATGGSGLSYSTNGIQSTNGNTATLDIELNNYMKPGSIIALTLYVSYSTAERGYDLYSSDGNSKIASLTTTNSDSTTIQYKVKEGDGLDGTKGFKLIKANTLLIYLKSLSVIDCQPGGVIPESGWTTYSCNKALDLSTISGGTAYIATTVNNGSNNVIVKKCNNIVESGTGLMIKGTAGDTFTINATKEASNIVETNLMVGLPHGGTAPTGSYVFGWPSGKADEYGFYYINSTEPTLGLGKAYLTSPQASNGAKLRISFDDEENTTTDIQNAKEFKQQNREYFNLQGQRVLTPKKGLYISNGKKIINK